MGMLSKSGKIGVFLYLHKIVPIGACQEDYQEQNLHLFMFHPNVHPEYDNYNCWKNQDHCSSKEIATVAAAEPSQELLPTFYSCIAKMKMSSWDSPQPHNILSP